MHIQRQKPREPKVKYFENVLGSLLRQLRGKLAALETRPKVLHRLGSYVVSCLCVIGFAIGHGSINFVTKMILWGIRLKCRAGHNCCYKANDKEDRYTCGINIIPRTAR